MTQEEKQLLLKDLSARLSYGVKVRLDTGNKAFDTDLVGIPSNNTVTIHDTENYETIEECFIWDIKPYLRPMSSMTEEERNEYFDFRNQELQRVAFAEVGRESAIAEISDWLNAHHFDYRGLIEKGLAIAVTEENNPY